MGQSETHSWWRTSDRLHRMFHSLQMWATKTQPNTSVKFWDRQVGTTPTSWFTVSLVQLFISLIFQGRNSWDVTYHKDPGYGCCMFQNLQRRWNLTSSKKETSSRSRKACPGKWAAQRSIHFQSRKSTSKLDRRRKSVPNPNLRWVVSSEVTKLKFTSLFRQKEQYCAKQRIFQERLAKCFKRDESNCPLHYTYNTKAKVTTLVSSLDMAFKIMSRFHNPWNFLTNWQYSSLNSRSKYPRTFSTTSRLEIWYPTSVWP